MVEIRTEPVGYSRTPLFGGALTAEIPNVFKDMSNVRPIPDNQEVFASSVSDTNIIIELVERLERDSEAARVPLVRILGRESLGNLSDDEFAILAHMHDICKANQERFELVEAPKLCTVQHIPDPSYLCKLKLVSRMVICDASGTVRSHEKATTAYIVLVRLVLQGTDLLLHINVPQNEHVCNGDPDGPAGEEQKAKEILERLLHTLRIVDYGLFGN
ncbi:hypothetical protein LOZ58_000101 [Ophidiomyces ophidiicola]|nr:hypothetical protein LOZ65_005439 [Ophidiomyces ophidiicola]KAI1940110.1 hypothetical protein LOZ66_002545 [Ophidiomyces ophidiicola]KAI1966613.1 hypothetical protein LOZ58_000101 [Ophidiomyces ophidiicola]